MGPADVDGVAVRNRVNELGATFATKDVSQDPAVVAAHGALADDRSYHMSIGRWLAQNTDVLGLIKTGRDSPQGMVWEKRSAASTAEAPAKAQQAGQASSPQKRVRSAPAEQGPTVTPISDYGPQPKGDDPFKARMRFHQSWWRAEVLGVPYGTGPKPASKTFYGNMLDADAADAGLNFLTPEIHAAARARIAAGGGVEGFRCTRNLLSSQPMCFNLFVPLNDMPADLATACVAALLPDPERCAAFQRVTIEFAPSPKAEYLNDRTAFDAFIEYRRPDGALALLAIETKLTDSFTPDTKNAGKYVNYARGYPEVWSPDSLDRLGDIRWFQLWRNHLLAMRLIHHPDQPFVDGQVIVASHPLDAGCTSIVDAYRDLVTEPDDQIRGLTLDAFIDRWRPLVAGSRHEDWLNDFEARYLWLSSSESAWQGR